MKATDHPIRFGSIRFILLAWFRLRVKCSQCVKTKAPTHNDIKSTTILLTLEIFYTNLLFHQDIINGIHQHSLLFTIDELNGIKLYNSNWWIIAFVFWIFSFSSVQESLSSYSGVTHHIRRSIRCCCFLLSNLFNSSQYLAFYISSLWNSLKKYIFYHTI